MVHVPAKFRENALSCYSANWFSKKNVSIPNPPPPPPPPEIFTNVGNSIKREEKILKLYFFQYLKKFLKK